MTGCRYIVSYFRFNHIQRMGNYCLDHLGETEEKYYLKEPSPAWEEARGRDYIQL
jgi:hypothetical protein